MSSFRSTLRPVSTPLTALLLLFGLYVPVDAQNTIQYPDVAEIFNSKCVLCHNGPAAPLGLRLDSYSAIAKGSQNGPVAIPGNASDSALMRRIRGQSTPRMPLTGPPFLSDQETDKIAQWIDAGMAEGAAQLSEPARPKLHKPGDPVNYADVAPIFAQRCIKCHRDNAPGGPPEGLSLQSYENIIRGTDRVVIIPGASAASELVRRIKGIARPRMPFDGPPWLSEQEITLISDWIQQGAKSADGKPAPLPIGRSVRLHGQLTARWALDDVPLVVDSRTRIKKAPQVGSYVRVRGVVGRDGQIHATRIRSR